MTLQEIVRNIPNTDGALRSFGLMRAPTTGAMTSQILGTFALGLVVGAGAALLLAPMSGRELRERVQERVHSDSEPDLRVQ